MLIICKKCKIGKGKEEFFWKKNGERTGQMHSYMCKQCTLSLNRLYIQTTKGRTAKRKSQCKYNQTKKGRETNRKSKCKYRQTKKGKETVKNYEQSEKGKFASAKKYAKRRERESNAPNTLTFTQWKQILTSQANCCKGCNTSFENILPTKDHIVSITNGGGLTKDNTQALCALCNSIKGNRPMNFLIERLQLRN